MPSSGKSLRSGNPLKPSQVRIRRRSGCPENLIPNMSQVSRSHQLAARKTAAIEGTSSPSATAHLTRMRAFFEKE